MDESSTPILSPRILLIISLVKPKVNNELFYLTYNTMSSALVGHETRQIASNKLIMSDKQK